MASAWVIRFIIIFPPDTDREPVAHIARRVDIVGDSGFESYSRFLFFLHWLYLKRKYLKWLSCQAKELTNFSPLIALICNPDHGRAVR